MEKTLRISAPIGHNVSSVLSVSSIFIFVAVPQERSNSFENKETGQV
jgi:hypothetical protein